MGEMADAIASDPLQGNLQPGIEAREAIRAVLAAIGTKSRLKHGWLMCSGTMVNEVALKVIRQKKSPATRILAFKDCFAGRSTAMQEITDNPGYRQGQPVYGEVSYLSFYDPKLGLEASTARTLAEMREQVTRYPGKFAALMMEPIQGEGGFQSAPRDFYVRVFEEARKAGLFVWLDEIQTFGRTGELFAFQKLGLDEYVDVVTAGKMLQACMVLFTEELNPKPGLVAGTFSGSAVALRTARKTIELLTQGGYLGPDGRIEKLSAYFVHRLEGLGLFKEIRAFGGMIEFVPHSSSLDDVKKVLFKLYDLGVVAFYCGHGPYLVRMLPPLGVMTEAQIDEAVRLIGEASR
jgi:4-aminobutyrate aminotransferase-like enzyme